MNRIVFAGSALKTFRGELLGGAPLESAGVLIARAGRGNDGLRFVTIAAEVADKEDYIERSPLSATLNPLFIARFLKIARAEKASLFLAHTHPTERWPSFSPVDDDGEKTIAQTLYARAPEGPHGSLVLGAEGFAARIFDAQGEVTYIDRLLEVSSNIDLNAKDTQAAVDEMFDRNVRAFGKDGQQLLRSLHVGVVGVGGTGSFVVEELARLGVGHLTLIDDESVELTNLNRLLGTTTSDVGRPKVEALGDVARRARTDIRLTLVAGSVLRESVARGLIDCDAIFCCTDSHGSRAVINQIAYQYLVPTFDVGVRIDTDDGRVTDATTRVQMLGPGLPCLACYPLLSPEAVRRDLLTREARDQDPYIVGFHEPQPAVISINGSVTSSAVTMFLTAVTGLSSSARHLVGRPLEGTVRAAVGTPRSDCVVCSPRNAFARADSWPVMWQS
jgi:molybdopterin/thiamine biosynthesis adenylyltransferase